jgi:cytochrome c
MGLKGRMMIPSPCQSPVLFLCLVAVLAAPAEAVAQQATGTAFQDNCAPCHDLADGSHFFGPSLFRLIGRVAGTQTGFSYARSYVEAGQSGVVWSAAELDLFLADPNTYLAGKSQPPLQNRMSIKFPDPIIRAEIIDYLTSISIEGSQTCVHSSSGC